MPSTDDWEFWLLDLDGTLVDTEWTYKRETMARAGDRLGRSFTDDQVERLWYGIGNSRDELLASWDLDPETFWAAFDAVEEPAARAAATYLYDDAAFVTDIDAPVGLVTHCQPFLANPVFDRLGIRDWFDAVVHCSADLGWKPDPAPVRRAMRDLDVEGRRGVFVGDSPCDVGAAQAAGIDSIHVERHADRRSRAVPGDYRVTSFDDIRAGRSFVEAGEVGEDAA